MVKYTKTASVLVLLSYLTLINKYDLHENN